MAGDPLRLRLELLRLRGELQRAELARAAAELRVTARRWGEIAQFAREVGSAVTAGTDRPWAGVARALLRERPALTALALAAATRLLRGRRLTWALVAALAYAALRRARRRGGGADGVT
jgi:hypothetical protein